MNTGFKAVLAADMDYTLLMPGEDIPDYNKEAVTALKKYGIGFTIATGRSSFLVGKFAETLSIDIPIITGNGGALFDSKKREDIMSCNFTDFKARDVLKLLSDNKVDTTLYSVKGIFFTPWSSRKGFCENYNLGVEPDKKAPLIDLGPDSYKDDVLPPFSKFLLINPPDSILRRLEDDRELTLISSAPGLYDIMPSGVTKGKALIDLAEYLNVPYDMTFAIGDSDNDISMIEDARHGIAMGNATAGVKSAAEYITTDIADKGFAHAVYEFVIPKVSGLI